MNPLFDFLKNPIEGVEIGERDKSAEAIKAYERAIEIDPDLVAAYHGRDCVMDKTVTDCRHLEEDYEMTDHLAAMRVSHLAGHNASRIPGI